VPDTSHSLTAPARTPRGASQGGSRRERRGAGAHRHRAIPQAERGGVAREARAPGAPATPTDAPPLRFPPSHRLARAHDAFPRPQTRLRAANDEIIKLKIQIDALTSLHSLQRTLDAPLDPPSRSIPTPPSAASVAVGSPRPECSTSPASPPRSSTPTDAHLPSPESWSLQTPSAMTRREAWEFLGSSPEASARPPTPSPPRGFLPSPSGPMGFAAAGCLTPSPELSASCTPIPARTLRARPESVCYTEPSLKTKMRRPWSPPKSTRRRSTNPTTTTTTTESTRERPETVVTPFAEAAASHETEARTPLAFVTSRRHRRRVRIVESSSSECEESDAREAEDDALDPASASPAKPSPFPGFPSLDHYRSGNGVSREVPADDRNEQTWLGVDSVGDARGGSDADDEREWTRPRDSVDDFDETRQRTLPRELAAPGNDEETIVARRRRSFSIPINYKEPSVNRKMRRPRTPPRR
jgi:hypothetical protein